MGDDAYEEMIAHSGDRAFKVFGIVFIAVFAVVVLAVAWMGY